MYVASVRTDPRFIIEDLGWTVLDMGIELLRVEEEATKSPDMFGPQELKDQIIAPMCVHTSVQQLLDEEEVQVVSKNCFPDRR